VNSPFYAGAREISTVSQAVLALGTRAVIALALSTSIYDLTGKWQSSVDRVRFWRHSLEVAIASRMIAEATRFICPEEAFVAGLLHEIGLLVLEKSFPDKFARIWAKVDAGEVMHELEESVWGTSHARVGQFLLEQWNLPPVIAQAVGLHHNEFVPGADDEEFRLAQIVALGNVISRFRITGKPSKIVVHPARKKILAENLKLEQSKLDKIEEQLPDRIIAEAEFLEIEIGSISELLTEANRTLHHLYLEVEQLYREKQQMSDEIARVKLKKAALEAVKTIAGTFNHYINNASATILGRAQLVELSIKKGEVIDREGSTAAAMREIIARVKTISTVMEELKKLDNYETVVYHDDTYILDIENKIKEQLEQTELSQAPR
jgi:HD-like signal output (HDOD) protein